MDRSDPKYWLLRFGGGVLMILAAGLGVVARLTRWGDPTGFVTLVVGFWGFYLAFGAIQPLVRLSARAQARRHPWSASATDQFARASLPRRVFYLLTAIAGVDGPISAREREMVRAFVLEHFVSGVSNGELRAWEAQPLQVDDRAGLAARIAAGLSEAEIDTLFIWCALVAFADGKFVETEHGVLQEIARAFGLQQRRARMLFHLARSQFLREQGQGAGDGRGRPANGPGDVRTRALQVLGLPNDATADQIRKRHRELVRRFHPDAQPNLGPVAQREATERFQEIQRAYETLSN
jgi:DnaJ-domain-containing protein 1